MQRGVVSELEAQKTAQQVTLAFEAWRVSASVASASVAMATLLEGRTEELVV